MTTFLAILLVLAIVTIVLLFDYSYTLKQRHEREAGNAEFWRSQCDAARAEANNLQLDLQQLRDTNHGLDSRLRFAQEMLAEQQENDSQTFERFRATESQLSDVRKHLADELENNCRLVHRLNATEAKLADAELRIAAASENLANTPPQLLEQD